VCAPVIEMEFISSLSEHTAMDCSSNPFVYFPADTFSDFSAKHRRISIKCTEKHNTVGRTEIRLEHNILWEIHFNGMDSNMWRPRRCRSAHRTRTRIKFKKCELVP
jgi:hypothetical protein